jgi:Ni/Co efflux regulator RcnB
MKKLLALLVASCVLANPVMAAEKAKAPVKKEVKHHKKAEGTEIAGTKPDTVKKKK